MSEEKSGTSYIDYGISGFLIVMIFVVAVTIVMTSWGYYDQYKPLCETMINDERKNMETSSLYTPHDSVYELWEELNCDRYYDLETVLTDWETGERLP